jgi:hypothetical protein
MWPEFATVWKLAMVEKQVYTFYRCQMKIMMGMMIIMDTTMI